MKLQIIVAALAVVTATSLAVAVPQPVGGEDGLARPNIVGTTERWPFPLNQRGTQRGPIGSDDGQANNAAVKARQDPEFVDPPAQCVALLDKCKKTSGCVKHNSTCESECLKEMCSTWIEEDGAYCSEMLPKICNGHIEMKTTKPVPIPNPCVTCTYLLNSCKRAPSCLDDVCPRYTFTTQCRECFPKECEGHTHRKPEATQDVNPGV
ncbi:hypothetical protein BCR34DRAFT_595878 [Clohesyomyces aquaticus]|uniref:Uncharacterized protein n=1 Tax=Clohesyomyces aquaticus TaxID=1231657 RepID=A0A1Y2A947_9PLEO|nr:hypothetical protein BCR34DRAFT_595878 [Clohesyomyces aquaticus]